MVVGARDLVQSGLKHMRLTVVKLKIVVLPVLLLQQCLLDKELFAMDGMAAQLASDVAKW